MVYLLPEIIPYVVLTVLLMLLVLSSQRLAPAWGDLVAQSNFFHTSNRYDFFQDANQVGHVIAAPNSRYFDVVDTFENFTKTAECNCSSLDLHEPFHPLCGSRHALLTAMSAGGRRGFDAPYAPRGCDMRWFSPDEVCDILSRFEYVHILGDSMMRNLAAAIHIYLRQDLVAGARASWTTDPRGYDCSCRGVFNHHNCLFNSAFSTTAILSSAPETIKCKQPLSSRIEFQPVLDYPLSDDVVVGLRAKLAPNKPVKPHAFLYGHGIWNNLNEVATQEWTKAVERIIGEKNPWLNEPNAFFPRLFITPSAAGLDKPDQFLVEQGNKALARFERNIGAWLTNQGIEHLGMWNATIQANSPDGTHAGMHNNLLKAMMVFNWLNMLNASNYRNSA